MHTVVSTRAPRSRIAVVVRVLVAALFIGAGVLKLAGVPSMVSVFAVVGAGQWLRYAVGITELVCAVLLLTPHFVSIAAVLLSGIMLGATATQLAIGTPIRVLSIGRVTITASPIVPAILLVVLVGLAWRYRSDTPIIGRNARHQVAHARKPTDHEYEPS
ncbi:MAG TPA: DoxX family protein [Gemmatimonadaceae bacterium]|jgi:hypothetical protein|nr:DoxX family protein [Gemmatimonadaceae bacterium]